MKLSDPPNLDALAQELAVRRALSPQEGDADDLPRLQFSELRPHLPSPVRRTRRRRQVVGWAVGFAASAAAAAGLLLAVDPGPTTAPQVGLKGALATCGPVHLQLASHGLPLESLTLSSGEPLTVHAELRRPCHATFLRAHLGSRTLEQIVSTDRVVGVVTLSGEGGSPPLVLGAAGAHLLVLVATQEPIEPTEEQLRGVLARVGEGRLCEIAGQPCSFDVVRLEVP